MNKWTCVAAVLALSLLVGCGGGENPDLQKGTLSDGGLLQFSEQAANFEVSLNLPEAGSSAKLEVFADASRSNGIKFTFSRSANNQLLVTCEANGNKQDWSSYFQNLNRDGQWNLTIDVHNNERPAHILVWSGVKSPNLNRRNTQYNTGEDSLDLGFDGGPGNGTGSWFFYGAEGTKPANIAVKISTPQDQH